MRLDRIQATPLAHDPFDYMFVPEVLDAADLPAIIRDFPEVPAGGSFDVATLKCGPAFEKLIADMRTDAFRAPIEEKFGMELSDYPLHITVRGQVRGKDGQIHTDSKDKIITGLLYLNPDWSEAGGRLRLLRNGKDIDDYAFEVPPVAGNMLLFRCSPNAWHGHLPSKGRRLSLQFNWVSGDAYVRRERVRHRFSGWLKRLSGRAPATA